ncbi:F0F1 ATP synthase subunit delta [Phytoactinopolyspora limicola]|uniref:F0F1 ATP synthase subunit delta n=1 Tax=Phytoactinopolyspora limicola TaxID=2715536 RepID=UPI00140BBCFF|nr:F0F1 ATP synthase subunit delta [Phytoactinopolyspora limicola]
MLGSSRTSFEAARAELPGRVPADGEMSAELLQVSTVLAATPALRGALADSGTESAARVALVRSVLDGKVSAATLDVVADLASRRWNSGTDVVDAVELLGFEVALIGVERAGRLDTVEDQLFRVDRLVAGNAELRQALSDPAVGAAAKAQMLDDLLDGKVETTTAALVRHLVQHPRGRNLGDVLPALVEQSARRRERLLAKVKVAAAMSGDQERRLAAVLSRIYHREVDLQIEVDPEVLGGVVVRVGDEVIDGSVAQRLDEVSRVWRA